MAVLCACAEEAKLALSTRDRVVIDVPTNDDTVFAIGLARSEFVPISTSLFEELMHGVENVLLEANVTSEDVDQVR
jgi:molecular chaperone DnaK (HSP70)